MVAAMPLVALAFFSSLFLSCGSRPAPESVTAGFVPIFNGRDLTGWSGDAKYWSVENGAITGQTSPQNIANGPTYLIWRGGEVEDFELRGKYRFESADGNSGVQYRSMEREDYLVTGYQADFEVGTQWSGVLVEMGGRLHLARRGQKVKVDGSGKIHVIGSVGDSDKLQSLIKPNQWNDFEIVADGYHVVHKINGHAMVDVVDEQVDKAARRGIVALQVNRSRPMKVQFQDLQLERTRH